MRSLSLITPTRLVVGAGALLLAGLVGAAIATATIAAPLASTAAPAAASAGGDLVPTAADVALAANTTPANVAAVRPGGRHGIVAFLLRTERAELTVWTKNGDKTILYVRGQISSLSSTGVTVTLRDGTTQAFTVDSTTKVREKGKAEQVSNLTTGERAMVFGVENSDGTFTAKLIRCVVPAPTAPATSPAASPAASN